MVVLRHSSKYQQNFKVKRSRPRAHKTSEQQKQLEVYIHFFVIQTVCLSCTYYGNKRIGNNSKKFCMFS